MAKYDLVSHVEKTEMGIWHYIEYQSEQNGFQTTHRWTFRVLQGKFDEVAIIVTFVVFFTQLTK